MNHPWEHPDWYDLHDTTCFAGSEREPEHYAEGILALPPLGPHDHLVDCGTVTGKLAQLIAASYPTLGHVTLVEPNQNKLDRASERMRRTLPDAPMDSICSGIGAAASLPQGIATVITIGSVLMPRLELFDGSLDEAIAWLHRALVEVRMMAKPECVVLALETLAAPWSLGDRSASSRRLHMPEIIREFERAGLRQTECFYRFRDRVVLRASLSAN